MNGKRTAVRMSYVQYHSLGVPHCPPPCLSEVIDMDAICCNVKFRKATSFTATCYILIILLSHPLWWSPASIRANVCLAHQNPASWSAWGDQSAKQLPFLQCGYLCYTGLCHTIAQQNDRTARTSIVLLAKSIVPWRTILGGHHYGFTVFGTPVDCREAHCLKSPKSTSLPDIPDMASIRGASPVHGGGKQLLCSCAAVIRCDWQRRRHK
jgi:hypothetical protein